jgi:hypothetical protein
MAEQDQEYEDESARERAYNKLLEDKIMSEVVITMPTQQ